MSVSGAGSAMPQHARAAPGALVHAWGRRVRHLVDLAAAEARLAAMSGLAMLLLVIVCAASLVVAWILIVASVLYLFSLSQIPWPYAAVGFAAAHGVFAFYCWRLTTRLSRNLTLPELRHAVGSRQTGAPQDPEAA